jgi:hypothetical protein
MTFLLGLVLSAGVRWRLAEPARQWRGQRLDVRERDVVALVQRSAMDSHSRLASSVRRSSFCRWSAGSADCSTSPLSLADQPIVSGNEIRAESEYGKQASPQARLSDPGVDLAPQFLEGVLHRGHARPDTRRRSRRLCGLRPRVISPRHLPGHRRCRASSLHGPSCSK